MKNKSKCLGWGALELLMLLVTGCAMSDKVVSKPDRLLSVDYRGTSDKPLYDFFDVSVRTQNASTDSIPATFGRNPKVNTVRMLGGWHSKNIEADTYKWDGEKYYYDFEQATRRIDKWRNAGWEIFQIVLDNPPWAFQRGYQFVDVPDGKHYLKKDANGVYGNGLPPNDQQAWHNYIKAFIQHLIQRYGEATVNKWRFRVGSEIDTRPQHWAATRQEFFDHYKNTVEAVHAVLPKVKIGTHFREGSFKSRYIDYTGNKEDSYSSHFLTWAKANQVHYDFLAISYYPHITKHHELDMAAIYQHDIAPILEHPDWAPEARFEIHEYKFIIKMKRAGFESVQTSHSAAFFAMLSKMMLEKNIKDIYQWGNARNGSYQPEALTQLALHSMVGMSMYQNQVQTFSPKARQNDIDGIFTAATDFKRYDALVFSYNAHDVSYQAPELVKLELKVRQALGTRFKYRVGVIDKNNIIDQRFYQDHPKALILESEGGWRKKGVHETASAMSLLNEAGKAIYLKVKNKYGKANDLTWGEWRTGLVTANDKGQSVVSLTTQLSSFSVQKLEVRFD